MQILNVNTYKAMGERLKKDKVFGQNIEWYGKLLDKLKINGTELNTKQMLNLFQGKNVDGTELSDIKENEEVFEIILQLPDRYNSPLYEIDKGIFHNILEKSIDDLVCEFENQIIKKDSLIFVIKQTAIIQPDNTIKLNIHMFLVKQVFDSETKLFEPLNLDLNLLRKLDDIFDDILFKNFDE